MDTLIDTSAIKLSPNDRLSKFITLLLIHISGINRLNRLAKKTPSSNDSLSFVSSFMNICSIQCKSFNYNIPSSGPCIICVPVRSGIIEIISSFVSVYNESGRQDIKIMSTNEQFANISSLSDLFLNVKSYNTISVFKAAINHLINGGCLLYYCKVDEYESISSSFALPLKLANHINIPLFTLLISIDKPSIYSSISSINDWFYTVFAVRKFLSQRDSSVIINYSNNIANNMQMESFYNSYENTGHLSSFLNVFVPRGTNE